MDPTKGQKIGEMWLDFPFFDDIYRRLSIFWLKNKNLKVDKKKYKNKIMKYENILNQIPKYCN